MQASIARGLAYAPYADMLWMETSTPSLEEAKEFADAIHAKFPGGLTILIICDSLSLQYALLIKIVNSTCYTYMASQAHP